MRHLKKGRKFGRKINQRKSFLRNLLFELVMHERIVTTAARAKAIAPLAEKLITKAKVGNIAARRLVASRLPKRASEKLFKVIAPRFTARQGGYTRILKLGRRESDSSRQTIIEIVQ